MRSLKSSDKHMLAMLVAVLCVGVMPACSSDNGDGGERDARLPTSVVTPLLKRPPPLEGGALTVLQNDIAIAADQDRDKVFIIDLEGESIISEIRFPDGAQPGKVIANGDGALVLLGGTGEIALLSDSGSEWVKERSFSVCPDARGLALSADSESVFVSCASGELGSYTLATGVAQNSVDLGRDLKDVVVDEQTVYVSRLRTAEVLALSTTLEEVPRTYSPETIQGSNASVAWRMIKHPEGGVLLAHQIARVDDVINIDPEDGLSGYVAKRKCDASVAASALTRIQDGEGIVSGGRILGNVVLPIDLAVRPQGFDYAIAVVSGAHPNNSVDDANPSIVVDSQSVLMGEAAEAGEVVCSMLGTRRQDSRTMTSAAFDSQGRLVYLSRSPWQVVVDDGPTIELPGDDMTDTGFDLFHKDAGGRIACASCHPAGLDDAQTWTFSTFGERRTPAITGGILSTAPFHWSGDMDDFQVLMDEVLTERMAGPVLTDEYADVLATWVDSVPDPFVEAHSDPASVQRGKELFESDEAQCVTCHSSDQLTNNTTVDVGTGEPLQVPRLKGLALRAPYMHDGCADTLMDRFTNEECGGGDEHGKTSHMTPDQLNDMVAYLSTL